MVGHARLLLGLVGIVLLTACGDPFAYVECSPVRAQGNPERYSCPTGEVCVDSVCRAQCDTVDQCEAFEICGGDGYCLEFTQGPCEVAEDCETGSFCDGAACQRQRGQGTSCILNVQCSSAHCVDGVCCETACEETCRACAAEETGGANGLCRVVSAGRDPRDDCGGATACDGLGACFAAIDGASCDDAFECASGFCVDDVCCDDACTAPCLACATASAGANWTGTDGVCTPIASGEDPAGECVAFGCDGAGACEGGAADGVSCGVDGQCASGHCVDDVCCENDCVALCMACSADLNGSSNGACDPIGYFEDPGAECPGGLGCDGAGACNPQRTWGAPALLETDNAGDVGAAVAVAFDPLGNAFAVWSQSDGTRYNVWSSRWSLGAWSEPKLIEASDTDGVAGVSVATDSLGNAMAVWMQAEGGLHKVVANRYVAGADWGVATPVDPGLYSMAWPPGLAADGAGDFVVVWFNEDFGGAAGVYSSRYILGQGWQPKDTLDPPDDLVEQGIALAGDGMGNLVVVLQRYNLAQSALDMCGAVHTATDGWGPVGAIGDGLESAQYGIQLAHGGGRFVALWTQGASELWSSSFVTGFGWIAAQPVNVGPAVLVRVVVDPGGTATALWTEGVSLTSSLWYSRSEQGAPWDSALRVADSTGVGALAVSADPRGNLFALWTEQPQSGERDVWTRRFVPGEGWGTAEDLETDLEISNADAVAADLYGNAAAVWIRTTGGRKDAWVVQYE